MNDKRLRIYLDDHLALMIGESELCSRCFTSNQEGELGEFLRRLENEVKAQHSIVKDVLNRIGAKEGLDSRVKQGAAWVAEKLGRFKRNDSLLTYSDLSRVVELETLAAAAGERVALWDNLDAIASLDERLDGITFAFFRDQSLRHLEQLNQYRRTAASEAFLSSPNQE